jgi:hypothetical protein
VVDQFGIINAVYGNKRKDFERVQNVVAAIHAAGLKETTYTPLTFEVPTFFVLVPIAFHYILFNRNSWKNGNLWTFTIRIFRRELIK